MKHAWCKSVSSTDMYQMERVVTRTSHFRFRFLCPPFRWFLRSGSRDHFDARSMRDWRTDGRWTCPTSEPRTTRCCTSDGTLYPHPRFELKSITPCARALWVEMDTPFPKGSFWRSNFRVFNINDPFALTNPRSAWQRSMIHLTKVTSPRDFGELHMF